VFKALGVALLCTISGEGIAPSNFFKPSQLGNGKIQYTTKEYEMNSIDVCCIYRPDKMLFFVVYLFLFKLKSFET